MSDRNLASGYALEKPMSLERKLLIFAAAVAFLCALLYLLSAILTPFVAGVALGYLLNPVAERLQRMGLSRLGASLLLLAAFLFIVAAFGLLIVPVLTRQLESFIASLPGYVAALEGLVSEWSGKLTADYNAFLKDHGLEASLPTLDLQKYVNSIGDTAVNQVGEFARSLPSRGVALINVVSVIVVTPVVAFYMLLDWEQTLKVLEELVPPRHRDEMRVLAVDIDRAMSGFLRGQSAVCLFLGSWYALGFTLIGLNFGFLIGVLSGFLSLIPFVGSITAFVLSISVALVQGWPDWRLPAEAIAVVCFGLFLDGNILSPRLVGASVGLHPVWLMFALFAFGSLFGFVGMIIAVPVAAAIGVILRFLTRRYRESGFYRRRAEATLGGA
ncbi:MAG TPA: AI-2E family transporter [Methylocystis sp.]|nr:AI-2E family transporter [Methylocystis sp.]